MCGPQESHCEKDVKSKVAAKNGCDDRLIPKILITTIQVDLVPNRSETWRGNTNSPELSSLKFLLLAYHHCHLGFHICFHNGLLGGRTLFLKLGCFWIRLNYFKPHRSVVIYKKKPLNHTRIALTEHVGNDTISHNRIYFVTRILYGMVKPCFFLMT